MDEDFPPEIDSINTGIDEEKVKWVRAELICRDPDEGETRLFNRIEPNDICEGAIGDSWLMAAISSVAEFPVPPPHPGERTWLSRLMAGR